MRPNFALKKIPNQILLVIFCLNFINLKISNWITGIQHGTCQKRGKLKRKSKSVNSKLHLSDTSPVLGNGIGCEITQRRQNFVNVERSSLKTVRRQFSAKMLKKFFILVLLGLIEAQAKNVALVIGGYGGGNSVEVVTDTKVTAQQLWWKGLCRSPIQSSVIGMRSYHLDRQLSLSRKASLFHKLKHLGNIAKLCVELGINLSRQFVTPSTTEWRPEAGFIGTNLGSILSNDKCII